MARTVLLKLKSGQLITNQIWDFCYSYDYFRKLVDINGSHNFFSKLISIDRYRKSIIINDWYQLLSINIDYGLWINYVRYTNDL